MGNLRFSTFRRTLDQSPLEPVCGKLAFHIRLDVHREAWLRQERRIPGRVPCGAAARTVRRDCRQTSPIAPIGSRLAGADGRDVGSFF